MSAKKVSAPTNWAQFADATNVIGVVSSFPPGPSFSAWHDKCNAAVPVAHATANLEPTYLANFFSKLSILGPCVIKSSFKTFIQRALNLPRSAYGMSVAHIGVAIFIIISI